MNLKLIKNLKLKITNLAFFLVSINIYQYQQGFIKLTKKTLVMMLMALIIFTSSGLYLLFFLPKQASAAWFDENWAYRKTITVTVASSASNITNLETLITLDTSASGRFQSSCQDLRFTNTNGKLLPFYIASGCGTASTNVWVLLDLVPKNTTTYTMYMYYGNPGASAASDANKFRLFNGLVGYWTMNEASWDTTAGEVKDSSVNANNGTAAGNATTTSSGQFNYGGTFDGTGDGVGVTDNDALDMGTSDWTVSFWVKTTETGDAALVDKRESGTDWKGWAVYMDSTNRKANVQFLTQSGTGQVASVSTTALNSGSWTYVAVVFDRDGSQYLYINGALEDSDSISGYSALDQSTSMDLKMGIKSAAASGLTALNGQMDDVRLYNRTLSAAEIAQLKDNPGNIASNANATVKPSTAAGSEEAGPGPVGYWKFDEGAYNTCSGGVKDFCNSGSAGSSLDGASNGFASPPTATSGFTQTGKSGKALLFDGSNDVITASSANITGSAVTVSFWMKPGAATQTDYARVVSTHNGTNYSFLISFGDAASSANAKARMLVTTSGGTKESITTTTISDTSTWYHVVGIYDGANTKIYVNGILEDQDARTGTLSNTSNNVRIGHDTAGAYLNGTLDEVKIYPYARTESQIKQDYASALAYTGTRQGTGAVLGAPSDPSSSTGPVGYWDFEERTGTSLNDVSGNINTGTLGGDGAGTDIPTWAPGKFGSGLNFDYSDDYVALSTSSTTSVRGKSTVTISAWVKRESASDGTIYWESKNSSATAVRATIAIQSGNFYFRYRTTDAAGVTEVDSGISPTVNQWYHVAVTVDTSNVKIYVNGVLVASPASGLTAFTDSAPAALEIGRAACGTAGCILDGSIDELKVYTYVRTQKQIVQDMNAGHPSVGSPVGSAVGYWKFDEGVDNTCSGGSNDFCNSGSAGSSLDGAGSGFASPATAASGWSQSGKFNRGLVFDGSDDVVTITNANAIDFDVGLSNFTFSTWVYTDSDGEGDTGQILQKGTNTYLRTDSQSGSNLDIEANLDLATTDANVNITSAITTASWNHIAATWDGTTLTVYVNGISKGTPGTGSGAISADSNNLLIGGTTTANFDGIIDEVKVYNFALTADEIKQEYNRGSSLVMGALGDNSSYQTNAANQEYCIPGDTTSCAAPVGRWDFEEGSGGTVYDKSGNGYSGTWNGSTANHWTPGKIGRGGRFTSANSDFVEANNQLVSAYPFTMEAWFKTADTATITGTIFSIADKDVANITYGVYLSSNNAKIWASDGTTSNGAASSTTYNDANWHHIAGVFTSATSKTLYVDGRLVATLSTNISYNSAVDRFSIGRWGDSTPDGYFNGVIDQARVFNYARSAAQINWDYNRGAPLGWWKLDECQGDTANDSSGNGNTGTITIGATGDEDTIGTCSTSSTAWGSGATGKKNYSLDFDGTDDYISVTDTANLRFDASTADFSLFAWVKRTTTGAEYIISKEDADNDGYRLLFTSSNTVQCSEDATDVTSSSTITDTNWHFVGCTIDRDGNGQVYIDGRADGSATSMGTDAMATTSNITIGTRSYTSTSYFNGQIDDVRIYNYALTPTQIKTMMNEGAVKFGPSTGSP